MKKSEKINYLTENFFGEWISMRIKVDEELSSSQPLFCICGKLATGLHERSCAKFKTKVDSITLEKLSYLLKEKKK